MPSRKNVPDFLLRMHRLIFAVAIIPMRLIIYSIVSCNRLSRSG